MEHVDLRQMGQHGGGQMLPRAPSGRGVGQLARVGAGEVDDLPEAVLGQVLAGDEHVGPADHHGHRREITHGIIGELGIEPHIEGHVGDAAQQQRIAIGRGLGGDVRAHQGAGARAILHDHRLAEQGLQPIRHHAGHRVETTPGGLGNDDLDRMIGKILRPRREREDERPAHCEGGEGAAPYGNH